MNEYKIYIDMDKIDWDTDGSPHNPVASKMYSEITLHFYKELMQDVNELKKNLNANKTVGDIHITHKIEGKNIKTEYLLEGGKKYVEISTYKSLYTNNGPDQELLLAIARAEINAQMSLIFNKFELHNFPAIGFFMTLAESRLPNNLLRNFVKTHLYRFRKM